MAQIEIYTTGACPYCEQAKQLLKRKNAAFTEKRIDTEPGLVDEAVERSGGRRTVPQIFINDEHVGGYDEMAALDREGRLDAMLAD
jgi:glutaredoxin 3